jgi:hypothetical protein
MGVYLSLVSVKHVASSQRRWAAIAGITFIAAVVLGGSLQLGDVTLPSIISPARQIAVGIFGALLILSSFLIVEHAGPGRKPGILGDPDFWRKVFDAMPPAFIKEYPADAHLADNQPFRTLQGDKPREGDDSTELHALINADHRQGDRTAFKNGASVQLELSDRVPTKNPQLILTFKRRIEHDGRTLIAGWFVPIDSLGVLCNSETVEFRNRGEQVLFRLPASPTAGESVFLADVGKAVRHLHRPGTNWWWRRSARH